MAHSDIETADFGLLEALVLSGQMDQDQLIGLMHRRPDFASQFSNRARQRQSQVLGELPIAAE
jgi:ABC-type transporter Mla MlaB component